MNPRIVKIARNIMFLLSVPLIITAFAFAQVERKSDVCMGVSVSIQNPEISFVTKKDVMEIVTSQDIVPKQTLTKSIDLTQLENALMENKWIKSSNAFLDPNHVLNLSLEQRKPEVRIVEKDSSDFAYYLDEYANPIPISDQYSPRLPVVTAHSIGFSQKELDFKSDLVTLSKFIQQDTFWNAAISQIDVDEKGQIVLIPVLGTQTILFGDITNMPNKFDRLLLFYKHSMHKVDWSKYDELDVRFSGQVICRNHSGAILSVDPYDKQQQKAIATKIANQSTTPQVTPTQNSSAKTVSAKSPSKQNTQTSKPAAKNSTNAKSETKKPEIKKTATKSGTSAPKPETKKVANPKPQTP